MTRPEPLPSRIVLAVPAEIAERVGRARRDSPPPCGSPCDSWSTLAGRCTRGNRCSVHNDHNEETDND